MPYIPERRPLPAADTARSGIAALQMLLLWFCLLSAGAYPLIAVAAANTARSSIIVLASAPGTGLDWKAADSPLFENRRLFVTQTTVKGKKWERLNLGFFDSDRQAKTLLPAILKIYPGAWISKDKQDRKRFLTVADIKPASTKQTGNSHASASRTQLTGKQLGELMTRAKTAFKQKKYPQAIRLFTAVVQAEDNQYSQEALELLGLSRQRNGQNSHAFDIYTHYLERYTEGDGSKRVRQRLSALMTETRAPRKSIRMSSEKETGEFIYYGSWSQFYRKDMTDSNETGPVTVNSELISFLDLTVIQKNAGTTHKGQFTADDSYDFLDDDKDNEFRFIEMYYELTYRDSGSSARIGRQSLNIGGQFKRFDGLSGGFQFTPDLRLNLLAGYPVGFDNKSSINTDKKFFGFVFETGTFLEYWNMNFFHIHQYVFGLDDSTSTGAEVRYTDNTKLLYGMVDYDYVYQVFNIAQINANLNLPAGRSLYMNAYMRKSPILATSNALIGRQETSIAELEQTLNIEQIHQLARDRTANSQIISVGGTQPINERFRLTGDITLSRVGSTVASGGVEATPVMGPDQILSLQLVGSDLFLDNDTGVLGMRYLNTDTSDTLSLIANSRFPITREWRINPRLQFDIRNIANGRSQHKIRALVRTDYRYRRSIRFDLEVGYDDISDEMNGESFDRSDWFFTLGYRWDF